MIDGEPILRAMEACKSGEVAEGETRAGNHVRGPISKVQGPNSDGEIVARIENEEGDPGGIRRGWVPVENISYPEDEG